jgi:catechol 2,3-dioxygenase
MEDQPTSNAATQVAIHPDTYIGPVTLRVADLDRSLDFYQGILGFRVIERYTGGAVLGSEDGSPLLELREVRGAPPQPRWSTGLYHVAILLPSRPDLGQALIRMARAGLDIGQADHLVSEALYISDPDGNGLEIYRDRPRSEWAWDNGTVRMAVDPLDLHAIMEEGRSAERQWDVIPAGTRVGHIHLQVGDIARARQFYHDILGFDVVALMPGAIFLSAGGYHHHIGANTWQSRGAAPAPDTGAGLHEFVVAVPDRAALEDVKARLEANGIPVQEEQGALVAADPWQNRIRFAIEPSQARGQ